jgi:hypothetical protein
MSIFQKYKYSKPNCVLPPYIEIKKSMIEGSGDGAFATCDIPAGVTIGEYLGKVYTSKDMNKTKGEYLFSVSKDGKEVKIIDGKVKKYSSWVRYVNSPQAAGEGNAYFYQYNERIFIKTSKVIPKGQEIYAYYGDTYIDIHLKKYFTQDNKPKISTKLSGVKC